VSAPLSRSLDRLPLLDPDSLRAAREFADKAVKMHKIFAVQGRYPVIRAALRARGWVEQCMHSSKQKVHHSDDAEKPPDPQRLHDLMSHLVRNKMVYFYWTNRRHSINSNNLHKDQFTNHFEKAGTFTTKVGLCMNLRNLHWFDSANPDTFFPRCYRLGAQDERIAFIEDYRRTACVGLLKYIVEMDRGVQGEGPSYNIKCTTSLLRLCQRKQNKRQPRLDLSQITSSALQVCQEFLESFEHHDIDMSSETPPMLSQLLSGLSSEMKAVSPQLEIDGIHNIWIIKPGAKSRGRGIKCARRLDQILRVVDGDPTLINERKWVVQKYLERPFLVHGTKFDVRQWFLVTDWNPLTIWFYKKCYLRFSTQPYSLDTLDSSVHLCNNSIQKHLTPSQQRHQCIPTDNMWSDKEFRAFLSTGGRKSQWETVVVPGMKKAVIHALQTSQDLMDSRKNTFELYGADFMLGRDLHPWLIEINASPTMAPSTPVTARLCAAVQEDTLRVVLDRRLDRTANTGDFELIYKQAAVDIPQYVGVNLLVEGFAIKGASPLPPLRSSKRSAPKHRGAITEKNPAEKVKLLPKMRAVKSLLQNTSGTVCEPITSSARESEQVDLQRFWASLVVEPWIKR
uniref:Tubulin tyrosine ligase-like family, member 3 n=1 Tax=Salarias fasciatus TaxID=181472 RepID=A0A672I1I2_SALFA